MAEGDPAAREQLRRVEHVLQSELGLSSLGYPRDASPRDRALAIHQALMTKVGRGSADHLLVMYQDWMGLDNTFRSTPPGNALGEKWRDRMPMTVEDLQTNQGEPAQQTNQRVQLVMDDPQARRKQAAFERAIEPRILRMRPMRGGEDDVRHKVIRKAGEKVQVWAEVMPSAYQSEATESDVQTTLWQLERPDNPTNHPMRLYAVLPEGSRLYYAEFPAPAIGEYVLTTQVKDPRSGQWLKATGPYEEPFLTVQPASGLEESDGQETESQMPGVFQHHFAGLEEMPFQRLATSILHYRYGRSPLSQGQDLLSPEEQFRRSAVANRIVELLQRPQDQGFSSFVDLIRQMSLLASSHEYRNLTDLLDPNTEWGENLPPRIVTADISRVFSDLLRFRWDLHQTLYSWLVRIAMLSQDHSPRDMQLAVDILRSAEVGEIVLVGMQSNFSTTTGGMGPYMQELTKGLARMGINVTVIVPVFQSGKERVLKENFARDTGKIVKVPFQGGEEAWIKLYEARSEDGVRVLYMENDKYFNKLARSNGDPDGSGVYGSSGAFQLRAARVLSLGALLAIRAMKIHPSVIQTNDDHSALLSLYLRQGEPDSAHELDTRGDDVDVSIKFSGDESLNKTRTIHVIHALTPGYNLSVHTVTDEERRHVLLYDVGRDPGLRNLESLYHPLNSADISPLHDAIVHADHVVTVSKGFWQDSMSEQYRPLFGGFTEVLRWKASLGRYTGIPNGFNTADLQRRNFSPDVLPMTFSEMGVREGRRYWARRLFETVLPRRKAQLQERLGLPQNRDFFVYTTLARVEETKGYHLLTAPVWSRTHPAELTYYQGSHHGYEHQPFPFEGHPNFGLNGEEQGLLTAYSHRTGVETLTALEAAMVLMPNLQVVLAGMVDHHAPPNAPIAGDLEAVANRFGSPDGGKHFAFVPHNISPKNPLYVELYTGSSVFGSPSRSESFGLAPLEAMAGGVPILNSRRGGLKDMQISFETIGSGFETYHPITWLLHLRHFYNVYYGNRPLWDEFRAWAIGETDFRGQPRNYRDAYRTLWQQSLHGGVYPDVHGDLEIELPVLEMASAINRSIAAGKDHSADELKTAGFSTRDANNALVTGIRNSTNPDFLNAAIRRYLPTLAKVPDAAEKADLRNKLNQALDSVGENIAARERLLAAKQAVAPFIGGLEETTTVADWVVSGVRDSARVQQPVAVLFDPGLVPGEAISDKQVNLIGLAGPLRAAFAWPADVPLELGLLSERSGLEERGYRIVEVVPHPESLNAVLPQAALPMVVAEALAAAGNRFFVNVGSYAGLEEVTLPDILSVLTNRFL